MSEMMANTNERQVHRMAADRAELADRIAQSQLLNGVAEPHPGVHLSRFSTTQDLVHGFLEPCFCVIAQGAKALTFGDEVFRYDPAQYMISTVGLPMTAQVVEASMQRPYLGLRLTLDPAVVASVMVESGIVRSRGDGGVKAVDVSMLDADLLDATVRLVRLIERPEEYRAIAPLVIREIVYRLLMGAQGSRMCHLATLGGQSHRIVRAIQKLRDNFDKPLRIGSIARELGMSLSGFHAHFRAVTAMSPLQFQKQIRLQEARRLMLSANFSAADAGFRVGYEDAAHFSRDYKRRFGEPPIRDVDHLRELTAAYS